MKKYNIGDKVKGTVTGVEDYGIFLMIDENTTGLIHISEISENFVKNVSDYAMVGDIMNAEVIDYDPEGNKLKLSIKKNKQKGSTKIVPIKETKSGFSNLYKSLDNWISEKDGEMSKK